MIKQPNVKLYLTFRTTSSGQAKEKPRLQEKRIRRGKEKDRGGGEEEGEGGTTPSPPQQQQHSPEVSKSTKSTVGK